MSLGPMHSGGQRGRRSPMAEINVTPMVDVMLVLLIIFMVTAPLLTAGVQVDLPAAKAAALDQNNEPVTVSIDARGQVYIDETPVPLDAVDAHLQQIAAASRAPGGPRVFLRADRGLDYGRVMQVMGEIHRAGLTKVALVTVANEGR